MQSLRHQRIRELLKREAGDLLRQHLPLETYGLVSVHEVFVSGDLKHAKILLGHVGSKDQRKQSEHYLNEHRGELQKDISQRVVMKYSPQVRFSFDDSIEKGNQVLSIIDELEHSEESPS
jgi:ribosome-binding factor A